MSSGPGALPPRTPGYSDPFPKGAGHRVPTARRPSSSLLSCCLGSAPPPLTPGRQEILTLIATCAHFLCFSPSLPSQPGSEPSDPANDGSPTNGRCPSRARLPGHSCHNDEHTRAGTADGCGGHALGSAGPAAVGARSVFLTPSLSCLQPHVALSSPHTLSGP